MIGGMKGVALTIRQKCAERFEEEKGQFPKEAYLDLIDLKTIMTANFANFEAALKSVGYEGGKKRSLEWMDRLNKTRRLVGHPLKRHIAGYDFSSEECSFLTQCDERTRFLRRSVKF